MTAVCDFDALVDGSATRFDVNGVAVSVVRVGDAVFAIADACSHADVSLADGVVWCEALELECPRHGSAFSLLTGEPNTLPATAAVEVFDASVIGGRVVVTPRTFDAPASALDDRFPL